MARNISSTPRDAVTAPSQYHHGTPLCTIAALSPSPTALCPPAGGAYRSACRSACRSIRLPTRPPDRPTAAPLAGTTAGPTAHAPRSRQLMITLLMFTAVVTPFEVGFLSVHWTEPLFWVNRIVDFGFICAGVFGIDFCAAWLFGVLACDALNVRPKGKVQMRLAYGVHPKYASAQVGLGAREPGDR